VSPQFAGSRCERLTLIVLANSFKVSTATNRSRKSLLWWLARFCRAQGMSSYFWCVWRTVYCLSFKDLLGELQNAEVNSTQPWDITHGIYYLFIVVYILFMNNTKILTVLYYPTFGTYLPNLPCPVQGSHGAAKAAVYMATLMLFSIWVGGCGSQAGFQATRQSSHFSGGALTMP
jgi:hypothetical protein